MQCVEVQSVAQGSFSLSFAANQHRCGGCGCCAIGCQLARLAVNKVGGSTRLTSAAGATPRHSFGASVDGRLARVLRQFAIAARLPARRRCHFFVGAIARKSGVRDVHRNRARVERNPVLRHPPCHPVPTAAQHRLSLYQRHPNGSGDALNGRLS